MDIRLQEVRPCVTLSVSVYFFYQTPTPKMTVGDDSAFFDDVDIRTTRPFLRYAVNIESRQLIHAFRDACGDAGLILLKSRDSAMKIVLFHAHMGFDADRYDPSLLPNDFFSTFRAHMAASARLFRGNLMISAGVSLSRDVECAVLGSLYPSHLAVIVDCGDVVRGAHHFATHLVNAAREWMTQVQVSGLIRETDTCVGVFGVGWYLKVDLKYCDPRQNGREIILGLLPTGDFECDSLALELHPDETPAEREKECLDCRFARALPENTGISPSENLDPREATPLHRSRSEKETGAREAIGSHAPEMYTQANRRMAAICASKLIRTLQDAAKMHFPNLMAGASTAMDRFARTGELAVGLLSPETMREWCAHTLKAMLPTLRETWMSVASEAGAATSSCEQRLERAGTLAVVREYVGNMNNRRRDFVACTAPHPPLDDRQ